LSVCLTSIVDFTSIIQTENMFSKVFAILALVGGASAFAPLAVPARAIRAGEIFVSS